MLIFRGGKLVEDKSVHPSPARSILQARAWSGHDAQETKND